MTQTSSNLWESNDRDGPASHNNVCMYVYVFMCNVRTYTCTSVCLYLCIYVKLYIHVYAICIIIFIYMYIKWIDIYVITKLHMYVYACIMYVHMYVLCTSVVCMYVFMHNYKNYVCRYMCMIVHYYDCTYVCKMICMYMFVYICMYIHIYVCICMHVFYLRYIWIRKTRECILLILYICVSSSYLQFPLQKMSFYLLFYY